MAAGIFVAPAVAFAREINPFGVAPFVAHEVEVAAVDGRGGHKAYHLVERHAARHGAVLVAFRHVPVHLLVNEPEDDGLVADKRLFVI